MRLGRVSAAAAEFEEVLDVLFLRRPDAVPATESSGGSRKLQWAAPSPDYDAR